jgi:hypothetical protein
MNDHNDLFPDSYESARQTFRQSCDLVREKWPAARLEYNPVEPAKDGLTIDWISAPALSRPKKLLILTSGQHGVEAFSGSAMLTLFFRDFLRRLNPVETGLLLIHPINPWGMKYWRRTNQENVDLNRNFTNHQNELDPKANPHYDRLNGFLNPGRPVKNLPSSRLRMLSSLALALAAFGPRKFQKTVLVGQHRHPQGLYYGGTTWQAETRLVMELFNEHIWAYQQAVLVDIHTGYGRWGTPVVVTSPFEPRSSDQLARHFDYPYVAKTNLEEFYPIRGDMIDYIYRSTKNKQPGPNLFAASLEFGTLGNSTGSALESLGRMILENQVHWYGAGKNDLEQKIKTNFLELFSPQDERWRQKATALGRSALHSILMAEGYLDQEGV